MNNAQKNFLNRYLQELSPKERAARRDVMGDYFCADEENANICSDLILRGEKTATCSMKYWYEFGLEPMLKVGNLQVVADWNGNPTSIIEITGCFRVQVL